jgi:hypothetical protein
MKRIYKAYNPLKINFFSYVTLISILWFVSFFILVIFETFKIFSYFALPYLSFVSIMTVYWGDRAKISLNGLTGESNALKLVKNLPKEFRVFSNITLCHNGKESETDLIILSTKGVFIVEVKNHIGQISGKEHEHNWTQFKETNLGGKYVNAFFNPTKQVKTHVFRLSEILKENGYSNWIQGVVYFVNPVVKLQIVSYKIPVLGPKDSLYDFLSEFEPKFPTSEEDVKKIENILKQEIKNEYKRKRTKKH